MLVDSLEKIKYFQLSTRGNEINPFTTTSAKLIHNCSCVICTYDLKNSKTKFISKKIGLKCESNNLLTVTQLRNKCHLSVKLDLCTLLRLQTFPIPPLTFL
jgi:hypothetical protein